MRMLLLILCLCLTACQSTTRKLDLAPLVVQEKVDLERFMGRWYVIANIPYSAERGKVASFVEYHARDDGRMDDFYFFRDKTFSSPIEQWTGVAWVVDSVSNARWKAQFIWPFRFDYLILETAPDYSWALVGHPSRDLAWVFHRQSDIDPELYQQLLTKLAAQKYDATRVLRVPQRPEQLGAAGFQ